MGKTVFELITASPAGLGAVLEELGTAVDAPWDRAFQDIFCSCCPHEDCPQICPHEGKRNNPTWWLGLSGDEVQDLPSAWRDAAVELPADDHDVLVLVTGKHLNVTYVDAPMIGAYLGEEGWFVKEEPEWETPGVTHWMEVPEK